MNAAANPTVLRSDYLPDYRETAVLYLSNDAFVIKKIPLSRHVINIRVCCVYVTDISDGFRQSVSQ